jgi:hypothetical protein
MEPYIDELSKFTDVFLVPAQQEYLNQFKKKRKYIIPDKQY